MHKQSNEPITAAEAEQKNR